MVEIPSIFVLSLVMIQGVCGNPSPLLIRCIKLRIIKALVLAIMCQSHITEHYHPWNQHSTWKWMVGRLVSFGMAYFQVLCQFQGGYISQMIELINCIILEFHSSFPSSLLVVPIVQPALAIVEEHVLLPETPQWQPWRFKTGIYGSITPEEIQENMVPSLREMRAQRAGLFEVKILVTEWQWLNSWGQLIGPRS